MHSEMNQTSWSTQQDNEVSIATIGIWIPVPTAILNFELARLAQVIMSYDMIVSPIISNLNTDGVHNSGRLLTKLREFSSVDGTNDFLQLRLCVDGIPFRQSASHVNPGILNNEYAYTLSGHVVLEMKAGPHKVEIQWKMVGSNVDYWSGKLPDINESFYGRTLTVSTFHNYMWTKEILDRNSISSEGDWLDLKKANLNFELDEIAEMRFIYSIMVRPHGLGPRKSFGLRNDLYTRLVIDGTPFYESESWSLAHNSSVTSSLLKNDLTLDIMPGHHTVKVQWRKWGKYVKSWSCEPSLLDGYASSTFLAVYGDHKHHSIQNSSVIDNFDAPAWFTVGDNFLKFELDNLRTTIFCFTRSLAIMGGMFSSTPHLPAKLGTRLIIDGKEYYYFETTNAQKYQEKKETETCVAIKLPKGSHLAVLQWRINGLKDKTINTIRNNMRQENKDDRMILKFLNANKENIDIILPFKEQSIQEDSTFHIDGIFVLCNELSISHIYRVHVTLFLQNGLLQVGKDDWVRVYRISGSVDYVNNIIKSMTYKSPRDWFGKETLTIQVDDLMCISKVTFEEKIALRVQSINDKPEIALSENEPRVHYGGNLFLDNIVITDADANFNETVFVRISISCNLGYFTTTRAIRNQYEGNQSLQFMDSLLEANIILQETSYNPPKNKLLSHDVRTDNLTIVVKDMSGSHGLMIEKSVSTFSIIILPSDESKLMSRINLSLSNFSLLNIESIKRKDILLLNISALYPASKISTRSCKNVEFKLGSEKVFSHSLSLHGIVEDICFCLDSLQYYGPSLEFIPPSLVIHATVNNTNMKIPLLELQPTMISTYSLMSMSPKFGSALGGTAITLISYLNVAEVSCQFDLIVVPALIDPKNSSIYSCSVPILSESEIESKGYYLVRLIGEDFESNTLHYFFHAFIKIHNASPHKSPINIDQEIVIEGDFSKVDDGSFIMCRFGTQVSEFHIMNSGFGKCVAPNVMDKYELLSNSITFEYVKALSVTRVIPLTIISDSFVPIKITGQGFSSAFPVTCEFGNSITLINYVSKEHLVCLTSVITNEPQSAVMRLQLFHRTLFEARVMFFKEQTFQISVSRISNFKSCSNSCDYNNNNKHGSPFQLSFGSCLFSSSSPCFSLDQSLKPYDGKEMRQDEFDNDKQLMNIDRNVRDDMVHEFVEGKKKMRKSINNSSLLSKDMFMI